MRRIGIAAELFVDKIYQWHREKYCVLFSKKHKMEKWAGGSICKNCWRHVHA